MLKSDRPLRISSAVPLEGTRAGLSGRLGHHGPLSLSYSRRRPHDTIDYLSVDPHGDKETFKRLVEGRPWHSGQVLDAVFNHISPPAAMAGMSGRGGFALHKLVPHPQPVSSGGIHWTPGTSTAQGLSYEMSAFEGRLTTGRQSYLDIASYWIREFGH